MCNEETAKNVLVGFGIARTLRGFFDSNFQDIKELVRCDTGSFNRSQTPGQRLHDNVYDGTAIDACEEFASGLHAYLSSPTERWFELGVSSQSRKEVEDDPDANEWLEQVSDLIYDTFTDVRSGFNSALHEGYLDLGSFGTTAVGIEWDADSRVIVFRSNPLGEFFFVENSKGIVDTLYRYYEMTGAQIMEEFSKDGYLEGSKLWKECCTPQNAQTKYKIIQFVCPRDSRCCTAMDAKNKPFASIVMCEKTVEVLRESGYDSFPFAVSRWVKLGSDVYGRSPAMKCMPDIMSLQTMERTLLKAGQKAVDPPIVFPDDGFLEPLSTSPGSIMFKEVGAEQPQVLDFKGNLNFGVEQCDQKREYIRKSFHADWFKRFRKNREQSATEVLDDRDEMLRMLAPMLGRQQTELLGPIIQRTYLLLHVHGLVPVAPPSLQKKRLVLNYISPAARAQQGVKADRVSRFMQDLVPVAQVDPSVMDGIKGDELLAVYAKARGIPVSVLRRKEEVAQMRSTRQQQQQMSAGAQIAEPASKALLNVAQAAAASGGGSPGGPV